jgi:hypothetical protein
MGAEKVPFCSKRYLSTNTCIQDSQTLKLSFLMSDQHTALSWQDSLASKPKTRAAENKNHDNLLNYTIFLAATNFLALLLLRIRLHSGKSASQTTYINTRLLFNVELKNKSPGNSNEQLLMKRRVV